LTNYSIYPFPALSSRLFIVLQWWLKWDSNPRPRNLNPLPKSGTENKNNLKTTSYTMTHTLWHIHYDTGILIQGIFNQSCKHWSDGEIDQHCETNWTRSVRNILTGKSPSLLRFYISSFSLHKKNFYMKFFLFSTDFSCKMFARDRARKFQKQNYSSQSLPPKIFELVVVVLFLVDNFQQICQKIGW